MASQPPSPAFSTSGHQPPASGNSRERHRAIDPTHSHPVASLESVLCTGELNRRTFRPPDDHAQNRALVGLTQALTDSPQSIFQKLADTILSELRCGSAGISLLTEDADRFHRQAIAGLWKAYVGGDMPRHASPSGDVLDRNAPQLFTHFERRYPDLPAMTPFAEECLMVPFYAEGKAVGTMWAIAHDSRRQFDAEDQRLLVSLSGFASAAYRSMASHQSATQQGLELVQQRADFRKADEFNRSIIESSPDCIKVLDLEGNLLSMLCGKKLLGIDDIQTYLNTSWFDLWQGRDRDAARAAVERAGDSAGMTGNFVGFFRTLRDEAKWWDVTVTPILDMAGRPVRLLAVSRDVTERRRLEQHAEMLSTLSRALAGETLEADIVRITVEAVGRLLNGHRCYFVECLEDQNRLIVSDNWVRDEAPSIAGELTLFDFGGLDWWRQFSQGDLVIEDVTTHPLTRASIANYLAVGVTSYVAQPFRREGAGTVCLAVTENTPRKWTAYDLRVLDDVVARVWPLVERARVDKQLRISESRYRTLFDSIDEGFCIIEMIYDEHGKPVDYRFLEVNPAFESKCGIPDATGKRVSELVPDLEECWFETYGNVARTGKPVRVSTEIKSLNRWLDIYACRVDGPGSHKVAVVFSDITERKQAEIQFRDLLESAPDAMVITDQSGQITLINAQTEKLFGYDRQELIGKPVEILIPERLRMPHPDHRHNFLTDPRLRPMGANLELLALRKDGTEIPVEISLSPLETSAGILVTAAIRDVTERRRSADALTEARNAAETANTAKDKFLAVLSHELRTPLTPVVMALSALESSEELTPAVRADLQMIRRNVDLETKLIDDLLDLSRIASGKLRLQFGKVDVNEMVRNVCDMCRSNIREKSIRLHCDLDEEACQVCGDPARLQQVIWNLLNNSTKFTPESGHIYIDTENVEGGRLRIRIRDTGIGIPPETLPHVFNAFEQGDVRVAQFGGMGLGLAICKALVEQHKGSIHAETGGKNLGSTFVVDLPALPREEPARPSIEFFKHRATEVKSLRLLIVEDHADTARVLKRLLTAAGHDVMTAGTVAGALALAGKHTFDLLVSDLGLPDATGYELMKQIKHAYGTKGIAMSGYGMEEDIRKSELAGFSDHLVKPVNFLLLEQSIRQVAAGGMGENENSDR